MDFVQNVPFFSIMISMFSGIISSVLSEKWAKRLNTAVILIVGAMSGATRSGQACWRREWQCFSVS